MATHRSHGERWSGIGGQLNGESVDKEDAIGQLCFHVLDGQVERMTSEQIGRILVDFFVL